MAKVDNFITVDECAALTGFNQQTIRVGIQQKVFPFGYYLKRDGATRGGYYIARHLVEEFMGIKKADVSASTENE